MKDYIATDEERGVTSIHFESMSQLLKAEPPAQNKELFDAVYTDHSERGARWYGPGNQSAKDVLDHAAYGWDEGYKILKPMIAKLDVDDRVMEELARVKKRRRRRYRTDHGYEVDIHAVNNGNLAQAWTNMKREMRDGQHKLVCLMIDITGHSGRNVNDSLWRAAAAVKMVDALIRAGKSVKVLVGGLSTNVYTDWERYTTSTVVVKQYNEPLALERLAAMAHIGFFRVQDFLSVAVHPDYKLRPSFGREADGFHRLDRSPVQIHKEVQDGHTHYVYLPKAMSKQEAQRGLHKAVMSFLKQSGGEDE